jgi:hypothetical protein
VEWPGKPSGPHARIGNLTAVEQPGKGPHAYIDGITGEKTTHPQVPMFYYTCDEEIADLISIMNYCGIHTVNSCQDNRRNKGRVPRVWVQIIAECLHPFLGILDRPEEASEIDSLSNRMATEHYPDTSDDPWDRIDFQDNRAWHYEALAERINGQLATPTISIRFPATDLPAVIKRLQETAMRLDGKTYPQSPDDSPDQDESSTQA